MNEKGNFENEKRRFVNEKRRGQDPPEYLTDPLEWNERNDLQQRTVLRVMYQNERPFYSLRQLKGHFKQSKKTIENRLNEMEELGVLKSGKLNNGSYWWIDWEESEHPIPPDVEVYEVDDEETISEFFNQVPIQIGALGLLTSVMGGAVVWLGVFQNAGGSSLPIPASEIINIGLITQAFAYILLLTAITLWVLEKALGAQLHEADLFGPLKRE